MIKIGRPGTRNHQFSVPAEALDGRVTIITGRKESGKSHLAKMSGPRARAAGRPTA